MLINGRSIWKNTSIIKRAKNLIIESIKKNPNDINNINLLNYIYVLDGKIKEYIILMNKYKQKNNYNINENKDTTINYHDPDAKSEIDDNINIPNKNEKIN